MGNGECNKCRCDNCDNKEKNITDNLLDNNMDKKLDIIKNDSYESFDNEIKEYYLTKNNKNKSIQNPKNIENEKNTTNNNQENNNTENKKEKIEIENISINNNEKNETINNNININDKENKIDENKVNIQSKKEKCPVEKNSDGGENEKTNNFININSQNNQKSTKIEENNENKIKEKIEKTNEIKIEINKTTNNNEGMNMINNDSIYITNNNYIIDDNMDLKEYIKEYENRIKRNKMKENYEHKNNDNNYEGNFNNNININNKQNFFNINKFYNIYNIIEKNKLSNINDNTIIYNSILDKIIKIPEKQKVISNERFCVLTKNNFSYYKSKESYLNLSKPMFLIDLKNIIKVEQTILEDNSYYFGLICSINNDTKKYIDKINTFINTEENNSDQFLLGFRSKNKDMIIKWIIVLNFFIKNYDEI